MYLTKVELIWNLRFDVAMNNKGTLKVNPNLDTSSTFLFFAGFLKTRAVTRFTKRVVRRAALPNRLP